MNVRILIAVENSAVRKAMKAYLESRPGWVVVAEAVNEGEVLEKSIEHLPDVLVLDAMMAEQDGRRLIRQVRFKVSRVQVLMVSYDESPFAIREALNAGARGFVFKVDLVRDLFPAIEAVARHEKFVSGRRSGFPVQAFRAKTGDGKSAR